MQNFSFQNPTEIVFGKGTIPALRKRVPSGARVLVLYGGGSIKANGVYEQVKAALEGLEWSEFGGIEANPRYETCLRAVAEVKARGADFLLSVGGGSVLDATKLIAAAARFEGREPWDIIGRGAPVRAALPIGAVLTLPATGSESNGNAVITREATKEKLYFGSPLVYPRFAVLDPETTFSLPPKQVRNGIVDAFVHVLEQYGTVREGAELQDRLSEGVLSTLVEVGPVTLERPSDYGPRATFMWSATLALNGLIGCGVPQDWATHNIGHELTAFYGIDHAESLAIVLPSLYRYSLEVKRAKLEQYGQRVFGAPTAEAAIDRTVAFFGSLGMPVRLSDHGIDAEDAATRVAERFGARRTRLGETGALGPDDAAAILRMSA